MKTLIKLILQKVLGFKNYLFIFSVYILSTLKHNRKEGDFLHFLSLLPDSSTLLDIGANIGVMTVHMARRLPASRICAFEPVPENLSNLNRLVKLFKLKNVSVFDIALGSYNGTADIIMPEYQNVKFQGLSHIEGIEGTAGEKGTVYKVEMSKLDDVEGLMTSTLPVAGIKIDVENYEFQVLEGARQLLTKFKPIVYAELWENQNRTDCIQLLTEIGYSTYVLENGELVIFEAGKHKTQNFFFRNLPGNEK